MKIFISSDPGIGKTTLVEKLANKLKEMGYSVGGFITKEIRKDNKRVGFKMVDLETGEEKLLAYVGEGKIKVGKYKVFIENLETFGLNCLERAKDKDVIIVDELGEMEFKSEKFREKIYDLLKLDKPQIYTLHRNYVSEFKDYGKVYYLTLSNRDEVYKIILEKILEVLKNKK